MSPPRPTLDENALRERLATLRAGFADPGDLAGELEQFLRTAPDDQVVRVNPMRYASEHGRGESQVVDLFLHARKAGVFDMEWLYVCRVCGMIVESFHALNAAGEHFFCKTCIASRDADLTDFAEIGFTVSRAVRITRFHDPESLTAQDFLQHYTTSASALARDGTKLRDFYSRNQVFVAYVEPGETKVFELNLEPGFFGFTHGPEMLVDPSSERRIETLDFEHRDGRSAEDMIVVAPGALTYKLTNATSGRIISTCIRIHADELAALQNATPGVRLENFLSGSRLLSTQSFLDLYPTETVMSAGGLAVTRVAILFTDIKGATALYERVGDMKAFGLVREHFGILRDVIAANEGALVKTIGDAVMASFHDPRDSIRAALGILAQIRRFNDAAGEELITLKIGAHVGPCIAVTLNERLDYFGQTVNLAARVQGLAAANEICVTDQLYRLANAAELTAMGHEAKSVELKGIEHEVAVHLLRAKGA